MSAELLLVRATADDMIDMCVGGGATNNRRKVEPKMVLFRFVPK